MIELPQQKITELRTYIFGIISFDVSTNSPISLYASINKLFYFEIGPTQKNCEINHITVNYLILSVFPKCGACDGYNYELDGRCVKSCPEGYRLRDGKCEKIKCNRCCAS